MEDKIINKYIYINGPLNFFKLKKNNKTIYLFFDIHEPITKQQECENLYSINIDKYLKHVFKNSTQTIDFLLETPEEFDPDTLALYNDDNHNFRYIEKLQKIYINNKNAQHNIRFHYIDIRFYSQLESISILSKNNVDNLYKNKLTNFHIVINNLAKIIDIYENLLKIIQKYKDNDNIVDNKDTPNVTHIINKILTKYKNKENKKKITNFFDEFCVNKIKFIIEKINNNMQNYKDINTNNHNAYLQQHLNPVIKGKGYGKIIRLKNQVPNYDNMLFDIEQEIQYLDELCTDINSLIVDSYFLRRYIDKNYINNAIVYAGTFHTITYLWFLVKHCDFEIIEYNFINNELSPLEFMKIIKKSEDMYDIHKYVIPKKFSQCISMKPINF